MVKHAGESLVFFMKNVMEGAPLVLGDYVTFRVTKNPKKDSPCMHTPWKLEKEIMRKEKLIFLMT